LDRIFGGESWEQTQNFKDKGFYNIFHSSNVPEGTMILASVDGYLTTALATITPRPNDKADINALIMDFEAENSNHYHLLIDGGTSEIVCLTP
jgi:hypothetical protein